MARSHPLRSLGRSGGAVGRDAILSRLGRILSVMDELQQPRTRELGYNHDLRHDHHHSAVMRGGQGCA
jgi:hypothetical protein